MPAIPDLPKGDDGLAAVFDTPEAQEDCEKWPKPFSVGDIEALVKENPRTIKDPAILKPMAKLKEEDPIEYDLLIEVIKRANLGLKVATINELVDKYILDGQNTTEKAIETLEDIKEKALIIATNGDPYKYLIWQAQRNHLGDISYQKVLIGSIASTASLTSQGIQPGGTGDKGSGKSDACAATYHLVPTDRRLDSSLSPMALFYLQQAGRLRPGMVLFSDDVEYESIIPIYKRSTARFQQGTTHQTVSGGKSREALELHIPPRMSWWLTSVESVANEQANDRQSPISTDSSPAHKKMVSKEIAIRRTRKELRLADDEGISVARAIIADIYDNGPFKVLIPQAKETEWLKHADFRGQEQFWDLVDALAILRWRQRTIDADGWLLASDEDLIEAKDVLTAHKVANFADLTPAEVQLVEALTSQSKTQKELTESLNIAQSTLSGRLKSILAKSALITEDWVDGKKVYALNPHMSLGATYWAGLDLIEVKLESEEGYRSQQIALSECYRYVIGIPITYYINNSNRFPISLSASRQLCIEKGYPCDDCEVCPLFSSLSGKNTDNAQKQAVDNVSCTDNVTENTDKAPITLTEGADNSKFKTVYFNTDYKTDWFGSMRLFKAGDVADVPVERVDGWVKRGIINAVPP